MNHKKISIGTAQFGSKYGITNNKILSMNEIKKILNFAFKNKINSIDTAAAYGNAEEKLGKIGLKGWNVSSKFPSIPIMEYGEEWIEINLLKSLMKLKKENLDTFFVHDISQIHNFQSAKKIFIALSKLKQQGLIKKIGISIYSMKKLDKIINDFEIDVIQSPANILNNEIFNNKLNYLLKKKKY